jgi:cytochrome b
MSTDSDRVDDLREERRVKVWDPLVRLFHWTVVVAFFVAYLTGDDLLTLHVWAGYLVGGIVVLRVLWGVVGPKHARFSDFVFKPLTVWRYLLDLLRFRAPRYLGHSPAGGAMVLALLLTLAATVWSGLETYAVEENAGPLAQALPDIQQTAPDQAGARLWFVSEEEHEEENESDNGESLWEEVHEALSDLTFALVVLHIAGVLLASLVHRENLTRAMISGRKRTLE